MMKRISSLAIAGAALFTQVAGATVPTLATTFTTNIYVYNGTSAQRAKLDAAEEKIRTVIHTEEFRTRVLNFTYNGVKKFVDNGGLTNEQIYMKILNGAETLLPTADNEMDLNVKTYYTSTSTVAYTSTTSMYLNFNTKYLDSYSVAETAKTLTHEWLHKLGFHHATYYSVSRDYSVPYGIGRIMKELAAKY